MQTPCPLRTRRLLFQDPGSSASRTCKPANLGCFSFPVGTSQKRRPQGSQRWAKRSRGDRLITQNVMATRVHRGMTGGSRSGLQADGFFEMFEDRAAWSDEHGRCRRKPGRRAGRAGPMRSPFHGPSLSWIAPRSNGYSVFRLSTLTLFPLPLGPRQERRIAERSTTLADRNGLDQRPVEVSPPHAAAQFQKITTSRRDGHA